MRKNNSCLLGSDIGTSSVKTKLYTLEGETVGSAAKEYLLSYPKPNWIEVQPGVIWTAVSDTIKQALRSARIDSKDIEGIGISSMTPSCLPIDKEGNPLRPALIWCDLRSVDECDWLRENVGFKKVHQVCGNTISPYFGGPKWLWFKNKEPKLFEKTWKILQCNGYVMYKLTGEAVIDFSQAGLCVPAFDLNRRTWSYDMCETMGIDTDILPNVFPSSKVIGNVTSSAANSLGLRKGTPVVAGGGDFACSALGCGVYETGEACLMLGTAADLLIPMKGGPFDPRLINSVNVTENYISLGNVFAGGVVRWFRDLLGSFRRAYKIDLKFLDEQAEKIPPGSDGLIVSPHFIGNIAPGWNPFVRGVIFGMSASHTAAHIYRAILEGVAYGVQNILEIAREAGADIESIVAVDGGAKSRLWRQIFADVTNLKVMRYTSGGDATMADAILAAKGTGLVKDFGKIGDWLKNADENEPDFNLHKKYAKYYKIYREIYAHLKQDFESLFYLKG